jgi:hypothetical protein
MRAIEEKQAAKFAKQREHQKAFDKLRKQREYAESVRFKAKEMLDKSDWPLHTHSFFEKLYLIRFCSKG